MNLMVVSGHCISEIQIGTPPPLPPVAPDLVKQTFHAEHPGRLWLTDVAEMVADDGKLYLSALIDCFDSSVVGWSISFNPN